MGSFKVPATTIGVFSAPGLPRAPSSLQPHVYTDPLLASATVCIPPQIMLTIDLAGITFPMSNSEGFLGFLISGGASSPSPKRINEL